MAFKFVFLMAFLLHLGSSVALAAAPTTQALFHLNQLIHTERQKIHDVPEKCKEALDKMGSPQFKKCQDTFQSDATHRLTPAQVAQFCKANCSTLLSQVSQNVMAQCNFPGFKTRSYTQVVLLRQLCNKIDATHNTTCLEVLPTLSPDDGKLDENYKNCLMSFSGLGCPDVCKTAEQWVAKTMGCCYKAITDYYLWNDQADLVMHPDYWTTCGMKEPSRCVTP